MKKKNSFWSILSTVALFIVLLAALPFFNWDISALLLWVVNKLWYFILFLAGKLSNLEIFKAIFGSKMV